MPVMGLLIGGVFGLVMTGIGTFLGLGLLQVVRRFQRGTQVDCPNCGRPGGTRATPSGRGAVLSVACTTVLTMVAACGLPYVAFSTLGMFLWEEDGWVWGDAFVLLLAALGLTGVGYAAIRYINWYRAHPLVACACGWRADPAG